MEMNEQERKANRERQIKEGAKKCVHFNGAQNKTCLGGISYDSIQCAGGILKYACFGIDTARCPKFEATGEEAERARWDRIDKSIGNTAIARVAILNELRRRWREDKGAGVTAPANISRFYQPQDNYFCGSGVMDCPICKTGKLRYSRAEYNGHVHAACSTEGCVRWME